MSSDHDDPLYFPRVNPFHPTGNPQAGGDEDTVPIEIPHGVKPLPRQGLPPKKSLRPEDLKIVGGTGLANER